MNAREANEYLGKVFRLPVPGTALEVDVRVDDWKQSLGHDRLLVVPATGKGSECVNVETLRSAKIRLRCEEAKTRRH
jgi:hypothetical protein